MTCAAPGWAAWNDAVAVTGTHLGAHMLAPPDSLCCSAGDLLATLSYTWPSRDPRYTYGVDLISGGVGC